MRRWMRTRRSGGSGGFDEGGVEKEMVEDEDKGEMKDEDEVEVEG